MTEQTSTHTKQMFRYHYINYVLKDDVDGVLSLYTIARHLYNQKKINTLEADLGEYYKDIMERFKAFLPAYEYAKHLRQKMQESKDKKVNDEIDFKLRQLCVKLPVLNDAVVIVFECLVKNCDLKDIPIPFPTVRDVRDNRMPLSFAEEER